MLATYLSITIQLCKQEIRVINRETIISSYFLKARSHYFITIVLEKLLCYIQINGK